MKYLIWLVVALAVVVWLKRLKKTIIKGQQQQTPTQSHSHAPGASNQERTKQAEGERMVQCAHCGIHFPSSEAVSNASGTLFCSTEHRSLSAS
jgi:uncharacterized protein